VESGSFSYATPEMTKTTVTDNYPGYFNEMLLTEVECEALKPSFKEIGMSVLTPIHESEIEKEQFVQSVDANLELESKIYSPFHSASTNEDDQIFSECSVSTAVESLKLVCSTTAVDYTPLVPTKSSHVQSNTNSNKPEENGWISTKRKRK
jgi:hypothetical protein